MNKNAMDMGQYRDLFLQEADEQLEVLEQETLGFESDPSSSRLDAMFRAAHTIKGSSRAMGFDKIANLTHAVEDLLDKVRSDEVEPTPGLVDTLLRSSDLLRSLVEDVRANVESSADPTPLLEELAHHKQGSPVQASVRRVKLTLEPTCVMKFVRAFMAINLAEEVGDLVGTTPDRSALEEEKFETEFELVVRTDVDPEELRRRMLSIGEVQACEVTDCTVAPVSEPSKAKAPGRPAQGGARAPRVESGQTVRVDVSRMDELMNLVGELVIDRTRMAQLGATLASKHPGDESVDQLLETVAHVGRITGGLQESILKARMLPIETVFSRFPRMVRDLAQSLGKEIELETRGSDTEIDRSVIEIIGDPILHILRNSLDHGVEDPEMREDHGKPRKGTILLSAKHQENQIVIDIEDDGAGINIERVKAKAVENGIIDRAQAAGMTDQEAINLVFASGLSTAVGVSDVSGRGVGMDIVKSNIQRLGGMIEVVSRPGQGARFTFRLPLTLAIIRGLLVRVGSGTFVVPLGSIVETLLVREKDIQQLPNGEVIVVRGAITPVIRLREAFRNRTGELAPLESDKRYIVVAGVADQRVGLIVDGLGGEQEVVIKTLGASNGATRGISGATILGDGTVALIVDVGEVVSVKEAA